MTTEVLDLYDSTGTHICGTVERGTPIPQGKCLMLTAVMTLRSDGTFLMTRRAPEKKYAGRWEITGGCVQAGESPRQGAVRELFEETGIPAAESDLISCGAYRRAWYIHTFFLLRRDVTDDMLRMQSGETDAFRWVTKDEYQALVAAHHTIPQHTPLIAAAYGTYIGIPGAGSERQDG